MMTRSNQDKCLQTRGEIRLTTRLIAKNRTDQTSSRNSKRKIERSPKAQLNSLTRYMGEQRVAEEEIDFARRLKSRQNELG